MTARQWHSGPPPEIGWWPASIVRDPNAIRWWDGFSWSALAYPRYCAYWAAEMARTKTNLPNLIEWTERWWL